MADAEPCRRCSDCEGEEHHWMEPAYTDSEESKEDRATTPGTTRLARLADQAADYLARTGEPTDILRGGDAAPPAPAPGELAAGIEFCKRPGSGVPTNVIAAAEAWSRLQLHTEPAPRVTRILWVFEGELGPNGDYCTDHEPIGWLPLDALPPVPPAPGASDGWCAQGGTSNTSPPRASKSTGARASVCKLREVLKDSQERGDRYHSERNHYRELALGVRGVAVPTREQLKATIAEAQNDWVEGVFSSATIGTSILDVIADRVLRLLSAEAKAGQDCVQCVGGVCSAHQPVTDNEPPSPLPRILLPVARSLDGDNLGGWVLRYDLDDSTKLYVSPTGSPPRAFKLDHIDWSHYRAQQRAAATPERATGGR